MLKIFDLEKSSYMFCTYWLNHGCGVGETIFSSTISKFSNSNSTRSNNTTPTPAHVNKESTSTLKFAAPATPTQEYNYKHSCEVGVPKLRVLEWSWSTFFRFDKVAVASRSRFFRFCGVGNRSPYCF